MDKPSEKNKKKPENKTKNIKEENKDDLKQNISEDKNKSVEEDKKTLETQDEQPTEEKTEEQSKTEENPIEETEDKPEEITAVDQPVEEKAELDETKVKEDTAEVEKEIKNEITDEEKPSQVEAKQETSEKDKKKDKKKEDDDFSYIVRIANTDIDGNKNVIHGLTTIKGVGMKISNLIADRSGIDKKIKMGDLSENQINKIKKSLEELENNAPTWMLNHRKDYETGEDIHLIGSDINMSLRDEINIMKKIRSYRGIRHERGLRVRGQRTRANNRKGLALGVSKKREPQG